MSAIATLHCVNIADRKVYEKGLMSHNAPKNKVTKLDNTTDLGVATRKGGLRIPLNVVNEFLWLRWSYCTYLQFSMQLTSCFTWFVSSLVYSTQSFCGASYTDIPTRPIAYTNWIPNIFQNSLLLHLFLTHMRLNNIWSIIYSVDWQGAFYTGWCGEWGLSHMGFDPSIYCAVKAIVLQLRDGVVWVYKILHSGSVFLWGDETSRHCLMQSDNRMV